MKMTFNRRLMLEVLADEIDGRQPPHGAGSIRSNLENAFNYKWNYGLYPSMVTLPNKRQIHRTLKELWHGGLIVGTRVKVEGYSGHLPYWEIEYQLCNDVYKNSLITDCNNLFSKVNRAKHGVNFFGSLMDMGLPASEVSPLKLSVKSLIQRTHPDKVSGYEYQFQQMKQCADWLRSGIPLPTSAHGEAGQSNNNEKYINAELPSILASEPEEATRQCARAGSRAKTA
ncbi:hypothetical protein [Methylobacter psychrophilus]|uniref:hypothetical protein n=1 Tax=Methylobacter psychrophilus TaxID=96941 RepID=UPI0021D4BED4|nr:hypothetical protein [Methylobacter psychrophilus]